ncbi:radical SAM protein [Clostridium sp. BJN0001]|uniref:elongator complex protein 3 n=1 Tax=Clostridium sp. BJN0001 TaxID=2930219 RepID=UPI001FCFDE68|nr:radical SAM protein [Clostridium sp. BJN0001]
MSKNYYIIPIFVPMQGCPHKCVFCDQNTITGTDDIVTASKTQNVIDEYLRTIPSKSATVEVSFFGGTFTGIEEKKQRELLEVAKSYKDRKLIDNIRLSTRPDYINDHILTYLKEYGVDIIELGVQSLDNNILLKAGRGHTKEQVEEASALIKKYGFILGHQIMPGLPCDTFEKDIMTVNKSVIMKPDIVRIYPALVVKNTPMEKMYLQKKYSPYSLDQAVFIAKEMYKIYVQNDINVIRIGLQPTENINSNADVVAGPFHPAFRELVLSSIIKDKILEIGENENIIKIIINPKDISKLYADKKKYFLDVKQKFKNINVVQDSNILKGSIKVIFENLKTGIINY